MFAASNLFFSSSRLFINSIHGNIVVLVLQLILLVMMLFLLVYEAYYLYRSFRPKLSKETKEKLLADKEYSESYQEVVNSLFSKIDMGMSFDDVNEMIMKTNLFNSCFMSAKMNENYLTYRWEFNKIPNINRVISCSFMDNKFVFKRLS